MTMPGTPDAAELRDCVPKLRHAADMLDKVAERLSSIPMALRLGDLDEMIERYQSDASVLRAVAAHVA